MTEAGGASTQAGIYYQNSVAALFLTELLELDPAPPRERVVSVRVEAPTDIDDIVVDYADGHRHYLSAKLGLRIGDDAWISLWKSLKAQAATLAHRWDDCITLVIAEVSSTVRDLKELCERANTSTDAAELAARLTASQTAMVARIFDGSADTDAVFELVRRINVRVLTEDEIVHQLARRRVDCGGTAPATMISILRDLAGGNARFRATFRAPGLRRRLAEEHRIQICEPAEWGIAAYRETVERGARIEVPGTGVSGPASEMLVWPRVRDWERAERSDFEDELTPVSANLQRSTVDLQTFPSDQLHRCVVVAGPGHGKSALLSALAGRLATGSVLPVLVPLASLAASSASITEFLTEHVNAAYDVRIDWRRLAEQGLVAVLLDGLDEAPGADRAPLLDKLGTFSARYPHVPWLLTVRDPAVLPRAIDARTLEILPLSDADIARFAKVMETHCPHLDGWELVNRLDSYPDLKRLARIPLFFAMMLATIDSNDELPASRTDLIERYLRTLFAPHEHKAIPRKPVSPQLLRSIAAKLAYERLERGEIGASEREVRAVVTAVASAADEIEQLQTALVDQGVLRRQSTIRFQFPFPIVQEYLAATYLVEHMAETLPARIDDAIERPWAQVLQFALELHSDPAPIIRDMLARPDDAFSTGLRLVARCIANGATVDAALHAEVGDRLVAYWIYAHHHARDRVGQLIIDGFAQPISPALHQALHHRWLLNSGGAEIITRENDRALTLSVLNQLLRRPVAPLSLFHPLKLAISTLGDEAWERIMHTNEAADLTDDEQSGLDDLLSHFSPGSVTRDRALQAANDDRLPLKVRLNCVRIAGRPLTLEANSLVIQILRTDDRRAWRATELIALAVDPEALFLQLLGDDSIAKAHRINLAACLPQVFPDAAARDGAIERCRLDPAIPAEITAVTMLHAARHGDRATFALLVEELPTLSLLIASQAVSLFGHHPGRALAERAAALVEARVTTPEEATSFTHAADVGMRYIYQMDYGFGGSLFDTQPHAATVRWAQLLDTWSERDDLSDTQRMRILTTTAALGSERAQQRLDAMVLAIGDPDDLRYDRDDDYGQTMRAAVGEVRRRRSRIPLALAERLSRAKRPNVRYEGIDAIAAHGDHASLDLLLVLHAEAPDWSHKDTIESAVETLSAKLGIFVQREGNRLTICATPSCDSTTRTVRR